MAFYLISPTNEIVHRSAKMTAEKAAELRVAEGYKWWPEVVLVDNDLSTLEDQFTHWGDQVTTVDVANERVVKQRTITDYTPQEVAEAKDARAQDTLNQATIEVIQLILNYILQIRGITKAQMANEMVNAPQSISKADIKNFILNRL